MTKTRLTTLLWAIGLTFSLYGQVITQMARENTQVPRGEKPSAEPPTGRPVDIVVDTTSLYYVMIDSAQISIDEGNYEKAERCIRRALAAEPHHPNNAMMLSNLGTLQRYRGDLEGAVKNYTLALDLTPNAVTLLLNRAAAYVQQGNVAAALRDYGRVRELDPTDVESRYSLGMIAVELRQFSEAEQLFDEIKKINPQSGLAAEGLGLMYKQQGQYDKAIDYLSQVLRQTKDSRLMASRADCYLALKQLNLAEDDIRNALAERNDDPYLYILRAKLHKLRFSRADMERDIDQAVNLGLDRDLAKQLIGE